MIGRKLNRYPHFKLAIFGLLIVNTCLYYVFQTLSQGLDSIAWLVLLALFELETELPRLLTSNWAKSAVQGTRLTAIAAVAIANAAYLFDDEWLDIVNSVLWLALVILLEFEVRFPQHVAAYTNRYKLTTSLIYGSLALLVLVWMVRGEWLDAYDAVLWIVAYAAIELDFLQLSVGQQETFSLTL